MEKQCLVNNVQILIIFWIRKEMKFFYFHEVNFLTFDSFLTGKMVDNDFLLRLSRDLMFMFWILILLCKFPEFLMWELLIEPKEGDNILAKDFAKLWEHVRLYAELKERNVRETFNKLTQAYGNQISGEKWQF